jgi:hypothetical protein
MSEMIERAARAMQKNVKWSSFFDQKDAEELVRAAMIEMLVPTDEMMRVAAPGDELKASMYYHRMLKVALGLKDGEEVEPCA